VKKILIITLLTLCAMPAHADEKSHKLAAEKLLNVTGVSESVQAMSDQIYTMSLKPISDQLACKDPRIGKELRQGLDKLNLYGNLKDGFVNIYKDAFTEEELLEIVRYHESPLGQKVIKLTSSLFEKGAKLGQEFAISKEPELVDVFKTVAEKYLTKTGQCKKSEQE
jgi:hypothetical protein